METRIALITGATSGIGMATAKKFAENNIQLIICGRNEERLQQLKQQLSKQVAITTLQFDIRDKEQVFSAFESLPKEWRDVDILVNNAGNAHGLSSIEDGDIGDWDAMIDGNVQGLLYVSKAVISGMIQRKKGHIINLSSVAGKITYPNGAVYCASKKAVEAISEGMRLDLTKYGIKITNIAPGAVGTSFSLVRFKGDEEKAKKVYEGFQPLRAEDVSDLIFYVVQAPAHVTIADCVIYPAVQASPTLIFRNL